MPVGPTSTQSQRDALEFKQRDIDVDPDQGLDIGVPRPSSMKDDYKQQVAQMRAGSKIPSAQPNAPAAPAAPPADSTVKEQAEDVLEQVKEWASKTADQTREAFESSKVTIQEKVEEASKAASRAAQHQPAPIGEDSSAASKEESEWDKFNADFSASQPVKDEETQPMLLHEQPSSSSLQPAPAPRSGDPLATDVPEAIGWETAEDWESIKAAAMPQVRKAKHLYSLWKAEELRQMGLTHEAEQWERGTHPEQQAQHTTTTGVPRATVPSSSSSQRVESQTRSTTTTTQKQETTPIDWGEKLQTAKVQAQHLYRRQIAPRVRSGAKIVQQQYTTHVPARYRRQLSGVSENMGGRIKEAWGSLKDVWEGDNVMLREAMQDATKWIKKNGMEVPLFFLGTLLVLWMSFSLVSWMAFPSTSHAPVSEFTPSTGPVQGPSQATFTDQLKMQYEGINQRMEDVKQRVSDAIPAIPSVYPKVPSMQQVKEGLMGQAQGSGISQQNMDLYQLHEHDQTPFHRHVPEKGFYGQEQGTAAKMADAAANLKNRAAASAAGMQQQAGQAASAVRDQMSHAASYVQQQAGAAASTLRQQAMDAASTMQQQASNLQQQAAQASSSAQHTLNQQAANIQQKAAHASASAQHTMNQQAANIQQKAGEAASTAQHSASNLQQQASHAASTAQSNLHGSTSDIGLKVQDRLHHAIPSVPPVSGSLDSLKLKLQDRAAHLKHAAHDMKERVVQSVKGAVHMGRGGGAQPAGGAEPIAMDVLEPENYVQEKMEHGHVIETLHA